MDVQSYPPLAITPAVRAMCQASQGPVNGRIGLLIPTSPSRHLPGINRGLSPRYSVPTVIGVHMIKGGGGGGGLCVRIINGPRLPIKQTDLSSHKGDITRDKRENHLTCSLSFHERMTRGRLSLLSSHH